MQTQKPFFPALILFLVLTIVGQIVLSLPIRLGIMTLFDSGIFTNGVFTNWKKLDTSLTFIEITEAIPDTVWAKASDGEIYIWHSPDSCPEQQLCNQWIKNETAPWLSEYTDSFFEPLLSNSNTCNGLSDKFIFFKDPPGEIAKCYFSTADESNPSNDSSYYVLLSDGTVLSWPYKSYDYFAALTIIYFSSIVIVFAASTTIFITIMLLPKNTEQKRLNIQAMRNVFILFFLSIGGIIGGYKTGAYIVDLQTSGMFASWKLLDGPYKFKEIVDANSTIVWAKSVDGKLYSWDCQSQDECKWVEADKVPANAHEAYQNMGEQPLNKGDTCPPNESLSRSKEPPGKVIECALGWYWSIDAGFGSYFALLDDGTIWSWRHTHDAFNASVFFIPLSVCGGLIIGIAIFVVIMIIAARNSRKRPNNIEKDNS